MAVVRLPPDGVYVMNLIDAYDVGGFMNAVAQTSSGSRSRVFGGAGLGCATPRCLSANQSLISRAWRRRRRARSRSVGC